MELLLTACRLINMFTSSFFSRETLKHFRIRKHCLIMRGHPANTANDYILKSQPIQFFNFTATVRPLEPVMFIFPLSIFYTRIISAFQMLIKEQSVTSKCNCEIPVRRHMIHTLPCYYGHPLNTDIPLIGTPR